MQAEMSFDTREMERAMKEVSSESDRTDFEIMTANSDTLMRAIVYNTPRDTGALRAGFWPAWDALEKNGSPGTRRSYAPFTRKQDEEALAKSRGWKRLYIPDGRVDDSRKVRGEPYFEFVNKTHYIEPSGRRIFYGYMLNQQVNFWGKAEREATFKFGRGYEKLLRKHGKL